MARNTMTRQEERALFVLLEAALVKTGDGRCRYKVGETEQGVLAKLNALYTNRPLAFTTMHVAGYRADVFGKLDRVIGEPCSAPPPWVEERLEELAQRLHKLEAWAAARPRVPFNGQ